MATVKDPELDPIARQMAREDFNDLGIASRGEVLRIAELRKQTAAIERQAEALTALLRHLTDR